MSHTLLGEWCKDQFSLEKAPSNAVLCSWMKPEKRNQLRKFPRLRLAQQSFHRRQIIFPIMLKLKMNYLNGFEEMSNDRLK